MKFKKFTALLLAALLVLSLAACGTKDNDKMADMSGDSSAMTGEPKNAEEALALHKKLMEQENTILSQNTALWEKVFMEADKGMAMVEDGKNYGEFLLDTIESAKDQFTDKEYEMLKESATEISNIENKLTELENKYPEIVQQSVDGDMSVPAGSDMTNPPDDGSMQKRAARSSASIRLRLTATKRQSRRRRMCWPRRARPIRTCISLPTARPENSRPTSSPIPPPMWWTATATSWVTPS